LRAALYFLQDLRPDGFLGRQFACAHGPALQLGDDPRQWSDDDAHISAEFRAVWVDNLHVVRKTAGLLGGRGDVA
jgi:hypothetical protein